MRVRGIESNTTNKDKILSFAHSQHFFNNTSNSRRPRPSQECQKMIGEQDEAHQALQRKLEMQKSKSDELNISLKQSEAACEARVHDLHQSRVQCEELVRSKGESAWLALK